MPGAKPLQSSAAANGLVLNDSTACTMVQSLAAVLDCIERLMSQSAALPVPVPSTGLLMLCSRILSVDDSLAATGEAHLTKTFQKESPFLSWVCLILLTAVSAMRAPRSALSHLVCEWQPHSHRVLSHALGG